MIYQLRLSVSDSSLGNFLGKLFLGFSLLYRFLDLLLFLGLFDFLVFLVLLLGDILLFTRSVVGLFFLVLTRNWLILLLISLRVLAWGVEVAGVFPFVVLFLASASVAGLWSELAWAGWLGHVHLLVVIVQLLLVLDVGWHERL